LHSVNNPMQLLAHLGVGSSLSTRTPSEESCLPAIPVEQGPVAGKNKLYA
jgi:hypothetical protein